MRQSIELLDIGGEGRHPGALNLNPRPVKSLGPDRGSPIPNRLPGRAEAIPLPDRSVGRIIMERTPLRRVSLQEILRVVRPGGQIILRHHVRPDHDPHVLARQMIPGVASVRRINIGHQELQESVFRRER